MKAIQSTNMKKIAWGLISIAILIRACSNEKSKDPPAQLYDLEADLGETNNLYNQHSEIVKMMKQKLEEIKSSESSN